MSTRHLLTSRNYPGKLSIVVPVYNEERTIPLFRAAAQSFLTELRCETEFVFVNDGSTDSTLDELLDWARHDSRVKVIQLSRNFGHQIAATAGLEHAAGDAIVLMDADLQDPLSVIPDMIERYCEGYDVAYGERQTRAGETWFKRATAWAFYRLMRLFVYRELPVDAGDFRLMSRECLQAVLRMKETHRFLRGMTAWVGFPQIAVPYFRAPRVAGETKYSVRKMLSFAWTAATSFSTVPLRISFGLALAMACLCAEEGLRALLAFTFGWYVVSGWTSMTILLSGIGASLLFSVGVLGEYVGKLYEQSKDRPLYIATRFYNFGNEKFWDPRELAARAAAGGQGGRGVDVGAARHLGIERNP